MYHITGIASCGHFLIGGDTSFWKPHSRIASNTYQERHPSRKSRHATGNVRSNPTIQHLLVHMLVRLGLPRVVDSQFHPKYKSIHPKYKSIHPNTSLYIQNTSPDTQNTSFRLAWCIYAGILQKSNKFTESHQVYAKCAMSEPETPLVLSALHPGPAPSTQALSH